MDNGPALISPTGMTHAISTDILRDLFETVDNRVVIDFIKHIRFYLTIISLSTFSYR